MSLNHIHDLSLWETAGRIRAKELSAVEVTAHYLDRIQRLDPALSAFSAVFQERASAQAEAMDILWARGICLGPLHGVPYAVKDLFDIRGEATAAGCRLLKGNIAAEDAEVVRLLNGAGMVCLGKTQTVQFAYSGIGINHDCGTPRNPWKKDHFAPGGSSSGSAVAVAARMAPAALGTDTAGSVRVPAALCGITGLKPTFGRISLKGVYPLSCSMDSVGVMARSVPDAALVYEVLKKDVPGERSRPAAHPGHRSLLEGGIGGMRVAFAESMFREETHPEVADAVRQTGGVFEKLGARVGRIRFSPAEEAAKLNSTGLIIAAEAYAANRHWLENHFDELDPVVAHRMIKGRELSAHEYVRNREKMQRLQKEAVHRLRDIDVLLAPTTIIPAEPVSELDRDNGTYSRKNLLYLRNTSTGNMLNLCGLSIPCGFTGDGLPIGLMIYAKPFDEETALRAGGAFQTVTDWHSEFRKPLFPARAVIPP
jgi:aspartyl-tRNA(Asn)/glutamyl-tRNA(Gln) amidotransferase subunit A